MQVDLSQTISLTGNIAGIVIVVYWLVDTVRNWGGTPELKILKAELAATNDHLQTLIEALTEERR